MSVQIKFKYDVFDKVKTNLGETGMITSLGWDETKIQKYYVQFKTGIGSWYREDHLKKVGK